VNGRGPGYPTPVIPDDTAGRPLTPREQAAIADLERRLLDTRPPVRNLVGATAVRVGRPTRRRSVASSATVVPLVALLGVACVLVALLGVAGVGALGAAAVLVSVVATAMVWSLLPARFGGAGRSRRRAVGAPHKVFRRPR
jgi:hypothetical protein